MWQRLQPQNQLRRLNVDAVDVEIIGAMDFRPMKFGAAYEQVQEPISKGKSCFLHVLKQVSHETRII